MPLFTKPKDHQDQPPPVYANSVSNITVQEVEDMEYSEEKQNGHPPDPSDRKEYPTLRHSPEKPITRPEMTQKSPEKAPPLPPRNKRSPPTVIRGKGGMGKLKPVPVPGQSGKPSQLVFHCSLAHGSPTGLVSGFNSVKELYMKIGHVFDIPVDDILFCTLNTFKVDMTKLLGGQLGLDDFIYVHLKGQKKEVEITKSESALGLTITDNGAGKSFIKRIKEGSLIQSLSPAVKVGDHFEKLNGENLVGKRHFHVARGLRDIPVGETFTLRLIQPLEAGFNIIGPRGSRSSGRRASSEAYGSGKQTVRFKAQGHAVVETAPDDMILDRMEFVLEKYLGVSDKELALTVWDLGKDLDNPLDFTETLAGSELAEFQIPEKVIFDLWGVISDWKDGLLKPLQNRASNGSTTPFSSMRP